MPPNGVAPDNANGAASIQTSELPGHVTVGSAFTVIGMLFDEAVVPVRQAPPLIVISQVTAFPSASELVV